MTSIALGAGCSSGARPDVAEAGVSNLCQVALCTPDPNGVCQHTCTPDPGPRLVDCGKAERNYTFGPVIWTFDPPESSGHARGMYSYTDNSAIIQTYQDPDSSSPTGKIPKTWEPPTATLPRCSDRPNPMNQAIHIQGGPFLSWGGGTGIGLKNYPSVQGTVTTIDAAMMDVSEWEGLSFWARRGPDSQAGFRVLIGDKYTDDDINYLMYRIDPTMPRYCERVRECGCLNHMDCAPVDLLKDAMTGDITNMAIPTACRPSAQHVSGWDTMDFCGPPEVISGLESSTQGGSQCNTCQNTKCDERWPAYPDDCATPDGSCPTDNSMRPGVDRQFYGKPCSPYTLRNGNFGYWCFDPAAGEKPAEPTELCGDHWTRVVNLSNEWQFYTVPFRDMAQQGWAKRQAALDLTSVSVIRFTWDGGWIDFWIDDVKFYKTAQ